MSDQSAMRSPGQIRHKLKQVIYRHLQKELREAFKQTPENCVFNGPQNLKGLGSVHLCHYKGEEGKPRKTLCDSRMWNGADQARNCPMWEPRRDKETIKAEFKTLITSGTRGEIAARYPDVAALMWVLDGVDISWEEVEAVENEMTSVAPPVSPPHE